MDGDVASLKKKDIPTTEKGKMKKGKFNSKNTMKIAHKAYPNDAEKINKVIEILDSCGTKESKNGAETVRRVLRKFDYHGRVAWKNPFVMVFTFNTFLVEQ
uniref:Uncharacterized protein n=1 Tax=Rhodnius prolixus TaxID=13249 RepID=T1HWJ3_RHOPR